MNYSREEKNIRRISIFHCLGLHEQTYILMRNKNLHNMPDQVIDWFWPTIIKKIDSTKK